MAAAPQQENTPRRRSEILDADYVLTGEMAPEFRDISVTADNQAVIPPATMNQIVEKMEQYGIYEVLPEDLALCDYVDPSKTEIQAAIQKGIDLMIKEMA